jgi:amidase
VIPGHEYADFDGLGLAHLVRQRELTAMELVDAAIARVEELNPRLNAVIFSAYDQARQRAKMNLNGPLAGVPILLKDILGHKQGWPTRQGAAFLPAAGSLLDSTWSHDTRLPA